MTQLIDKKDQGAGSLVEFFNQGTGPLIFSTGRSTSLDIYVTIYMWEQLQR